MPLGALDERSIGFDGILISVAIPQICCVDQVPDVVDGGGKRAATVNSIALIMLKHWIGRQATCFYKCESCDGIATFIGTSAGPLLLCKDKMAGNISIGM